MCLRRLSPLSHSLSLSLSVRPCRLHRRVSPVYIIYLFITYLVILLLLLLIFYHKRCYCCLAKTDAAPDFFFFVVFCVSPIASLIATYQRVLPSSKKQCTYNYYDAHVSIAFRDDGKCLIVGQTNALVLPPRYRRPSSV